MQDHTIDATHNYGTIFIYDADFGAICSPPHVPHDALVPESNTADALVSHSDKLSQLLHH